MEHLKELRRDCAIKQKKGLHFILASIFIWSAVLVIHLLDINIAAKNLFTFCATAPLLPIAFGISKLIGVDFQNKTNPLTNLGIIFSCNQMLYLLIAMWVMNAMPQMMVMVLAIVFGAHLMPFGWLYDSKSYMVLSVVIPIMILCVGLLYPPQVVAAVMIVTEIVFSLLLIYENRQLSRKPSL